MVALFVLNRPYTYTINVYKQLKKAQMSVHVSPSSCEDEHLFE